MMVFDPLWKTMEDRHITCYALIVKYGLSRSLIDKLKHNKNISLATVGRICEILDCDVCDVVTYKRDEK